MKHNLDLTGSAFCGFSMTFKAYQTTLGTLNSHVSKIKATSFISVAFPNTVSYLSEACWLTPERLGEPSRQEWQSSEGFKGPKCCKCKTHSDTPTAAERSNVGATFAQMPQKTLICLSSLIKGDRVLFANRTRGTMCWDPRPAGKNGEVGVGVCEAQSGATVWGLTRT